MDDDCVNNSPFLLVLVCYNKTITWQEVSISIKSPNFTIKDFFVIKESRPVRIVTKGIKLILDAEYKKNNLKSIIMNLNYLLQKYKTMFDGTQGKYTSTDYTIELNKDAKPYHANPNQLLRKKIKD